MAVIDTSMDMPKSCDICPKRWKCELDILVKSYFPYNVVKDEYTSKRHKDCPLKEVPMGKWKFDKKSLGYWLSICSNCGHVFHGNEVLIYKPKYCSNCGALMVEEQQGDQE